GAATCASSATRRDAARARAATARTGAAHSSAARRSPLLRPEDCAFAVAPAPEKSATSAKSRRPRALALRPPHYRNEVQPPWLQSVNGGARGFASAFPAGTPRGQPCCRWAAAALCQPTAAG